MPSWLVSLFWCLGCGFLAYTLLHSPWPWVRRLGMWTVFATVALMLWFLTGDWIFALGGVALWFIIPATQALIFSRGLRFSPERALVEGSIDLEEFPEVNGLTRDLRGEGFVSSGDYWLRPSPFEQGYRLFRHEPESIDAAVAVVKQGAFSLSYLILLTNDEQGRSWITWNYPLAYGLRMPPDVLTHRFPEAESFTELLEQHREFLRLNGVVAHAGQGPVERFDAIFGSTLAHNRRIGLLSEKNDGELAYSWKGSAFIGWQVFCESVRG